jgi:thioredoxin 1
MGHEHVVEFTDANFEAEALKSTLPVIVDLWAPWCGPCKMLTPIVEDLAGEFAGKVKMGKLNIDDNPQTATKYSVISIPTLLFIKNGSIVDQHVGLLAKNNLKTKITTLVG